MGTYMSSYNYNYSYKGIITLNLTLIILTFHEGQTYYSIQWRQNIKMDAGSIQIQDRVQLTFSELKCWRKEQKNVIIHWHLRKQTAL